MARSLNCVLSLKYRDKFSDSFKRSFGCLRESERKFASFERFTCFAGTTPSPLVFGNITGYGLSILEYFKKVTIQEPPPIHIGIKKGSEFLPFMDLNDRMFCGPVYPNTLWYVWIDVELPRDAVGVKVTSVPDEIRF